MASKQSGRIAGWRGAGLRKQACASATSHTSWQGKHVQLTGHVARPIAPAGGTLQAGEQAAAGAEMQVGITLAGSLINSLPPTPVSLPLYYYHLSTILPSLPLSTSIYHVLSLSLILSMPIIWMWPLFKGASGGKSARMAGCPMPHIRTVVRVQCSNKGEIATGPRAWH